MLSLILTVASPFIVTFLTGITKNHVLSSDASVATIRFLCAILSLVMAGLTALAGDGGHWANDPTSLVNDVIMTGYTFFAATGLYHLGSTKKS